jgi:hypothetical protein
VLIRFGSVRICFVLATHFRLLETLFCAALVNFTRRGAFYEHNMSLEHRQFNEILIGFMARFITQLHTRPWRQKFSGFCAVRCEIVVKTVI